MKRKAYDYTGDSDYGQGAEAQADSAAQQNIMRMPSLKRDYTEMGVQAPVEYKWVMNGSHISVSPEYDHQQLFWGMNHDDYSRPHAWGTVEVSHRWAALWHIEGGNMSLHMVEKRLRTYSKNQGWEHVAITDKDGMPFQGVKVASDPGSGDGTVDKSWYPDDYYGDSSGADYYGESNEDDDEIPNGPMTCSECGEVFPNWSTWRLHVEREHLNPHREPYELPQPVVDLDQPMPADFNTNTDLYHDQQGAKLVARYIRQHFAAGDQAPIPGPMPFVYDVEGDRIYLGNPGEKHADIKGQFLPGGVVEGLYLPNGRMQLRNDTDMPYTVKHVVDLWHYMTGRQLPIKRIERLENGKPLRLAGLNIAAKVRKLAFADDAAHAAYSVLSPEGNVYVVGGAVRDVVMGKQPKDIDLMVQGIEPHRVEGLLGQLPGTVKLTGARFGVFRYKAPDGSEVEISLPRAEQESPEDGRPDPEKTKVDPYLTAEEDMGRRDFTINAMAVNLNTGELIDPHDGSLDAKAGRLRTVSPTSFRDDPLRTVRALTAISKHGVEPDEETKRQMSMYAPGLHHLVGDEVKDELDKLFAGDHPERAIRTARDTNMWQHIFPELTPTLGFDQKNKHHRLPLDDHLLQVLRRTSELSKDRDLRLAALLHDMGKPQSVWYDDEGHGHYYQNDKGEGGDHAEIGSNLARGMLRRMNYSTAREDRIAHLIKHHMFHPFDSVKSAGKRVQQVGHDHIHDLLTLREADQEGKGTNEWENAVPVPVMRNLAQQYIDQHLTEGVDPSRRPEQQMHGSLVIGGQDLINLGIKPGPIFTQILNALADKVLADPALNNRHDLLTLAQQIASNPKTANILDPIKQTLDPAVYDGVETDMPRVKKKVVEWVTKKVISMMVHNGWPRNTDQYLRLLLTGSLTTFQWSADSDFDVALWIDNDVLPDWVRADLIALMIEHLDGTIVPGTTHPIQCFVVNSKSLKQDDLYRKGLRSAYDLTNGHWIVPPDRSMAHDVQAEMPAVYEYARGVGEKFKLMLKYDPPMVKVLWDNLHQQRWRDQAAGRGDFAESNIVYKFLNNLGLFPEISRATGEYIARVTSGRTVRPRTPLGERVRGITLEQPDVGLHRRSEAGEALFATFTTYAAVQHQAQWADVAAKAKRLILSGNVQILHNMPTFVAAVVQGDHGTYECEVSRHDPNSQVIEQWSCTCPWMQYAFDRTRKWKKLEGRVCSHVLATYWQARATPLDVEGQDANYSLPQGQKADKAAPGQQKLFRDPDAPLDNENPKEQADVIPHMPGGEEQEAPMGTPGEGQPTTPAPGEQPPPGSIQTLGPQEQQPSLGDMVNPPVTPFGPQPAPAQQPSPQQNKRQWLQLWDVAPDAGGVPKPPDLPISILNDQPPNPLNPLNLPGKFTHVVHWAKYAISRDREFEWHYAKHPLEEWMQELLTRGYNPRVMVTGPGVHLEQRGGKIPHPNATPIGMSKEGVPVYRVMDLGYDPVLQRRMRADEGGPHGPGAPEWRGQYSQVSPGSRAEVAYIEPLLKSAFVRVPLNYPEGFDVRLHPHHLEGWVDYDDIVADPTQRTPFRAPDRKR